MDYDLIVVKTLERVYKNYYYIIRGKTYTKTVMVNRDIYNGNRSILKKIQKKGINVQVK